MNMVTTGNQTINNVSYLGGLAGQIDQTTFAYGFNGIQNGNNVATIVSFRPDGNSSITRVTESQMADLGHSTTIGLGLGDLDANGHINNNDVLDFYNNVNSNGQAFNPAADMRGLGLNDAQDWLLFGQELVQNNTLQSNSPYYVPSTVITYYQGESPTVSLTVAPATTYALNIPAASAQLAALTMKRGAQPSTSPATAPAPTPPIPSPSARPPSPPTPPSTSPTMAQASEPSASAGSMTV